MKYSLFFFAASVTASFLSAQEMHMGNQQTMPSPPAKATVHSNLTYTKDVTPILQQNCQVCHRPGEGTPFSMMTYETTKPWAQDIKRMVSTHQMPPWFEDGTTKTFENKRALSQADIDKIIEWVDAGAPKGDMKEMPAPRDFAEGWTITKPDIVFQLPKPFNIPAYGVLEYNYIIIPTGFTKDTWVQAVEAAPTDRSVVHHIVAYVRAPGSSYFKDKPINTFFEAPPAKNDPDAPKKPQPAEEQRQKLNDVPNDWLIGYAPGQTPDVFKPGQAKLIPAGSDIVLELHYMPEGKATTDQSRIGLVLAKQPPTRRAMTLSAGNETFRIPPGDPNFKVDASYTAPEDMTLLGMHPHMHMRGKDAQYRIVFPNGKTEALLNVPHYDWRWQLWYNLAEPIKMPKGTRVECTEHFDNSAGNKENPDPTKTVIWGQQSTDEMMVCMFNVVFDSKFTTQQILAPKSNHPAKEQPKESVKPAKASVVGGQ